MSATTPVITAVIVAVILIIFLIRGFRRGFLRILFTTFSVIVTIALSALLTQPLTDFLKDSTFVGPKVEEWVSDYVTSKLDTLAQNAASGQDNESDMIFSLESENSLINSLALPEFIKNNIRTGNTLSKYAELGVSTFREYITAQLTLVIIRAIAFVLLSIVIYLLLRIIFRILRIIQRIPILRGINRLLGGILGLAEGLIIIWGLCIVIIIFSGSEFGTSVMSVIRANAFLSFIYDHNLLVQAVHTIFGLL